MYMKKNISLFRSLKTIWLPLAKKTEKEIFIFLLTTHLIPNLDMYGQGWYITNVIKQLLNCYNLFNRLEVVRAFPTGLLKTKINSNIAHKPKNGSQWMSFTWGKMGFYYSCKPFMSYSVHLSFHFFIILFSETSLPLSSFFLSFVLLAVAVAELNQIYFALCFGLSMVFHLLKTNFLCWQSINDYDQIHVIIIFMPQSLSLSVANNTSSPCLILVFPTNWEHILELCVYQILMCFCQFWSFVFVWWDSK